MVSTSCDKEETASGILQKTIDTIDTIETIYYKQDMARTNPRNINDTVFRYREMYFKRLIADSIVGVKGHWYMYTNDRKTIIYEDIYDGEWLVRKNNRDSVVRIYDLVKYPGFKKNHFWGHNTLYGMQYELKYILDNTGSYSIERLNDTVIADKDCYQIKVQLENATTMPGFAMELEEEKGRISKTSYYIDKKTNYPIRLKSEFYSAENPNQKTFIDQRHYDIEFNFTTDWDGLFNTSNESMTGFEKKEMNPE